MYLFTHIALLIQKIFEYISREHTYLNSITNLSIQKNNAYK